MQLLRCSECFSMLLCGFQVVSKHFVAMLWLSCSESFKHVAMWLPGCCYAVAKMF